MKNTAFVQRKQALLISIIAYISQIFVAGIVEFFDFDVLREISRYKEGLRDEISFDYGYFTTMFIVLLVIQTLLFIKNIKAIKKQEIHLYDTVYYILYFIVVYSFTGITLHNIRCEHDDSLLASFLPVMVYGIGFIPFVLIVAVMFVVSFLKNGEDKRIALSVLGMFISFGMGICAIVSCIYFKFSESQGVELFIAISVLVSCILVGINYIAMLRLSGLNSEQCTEKSEKIINVEENGGGENG